MKKLILVAGCLWAGVVNAQPIYVNPLPNGGAVIVQPGAQPYEPPAFMNPLPNGGYVVTQPGAQPYEPPT